VQPTAEGEGCVSALLNVGIPANDDGWAGRLAVVDKGNGQVRAKPTFGNLRVLLEQHPDWAGAFAFDERAQRILVVRATPLDDDVGGDTPSYPRSIENVDATRLAMWGDAVTLPGIEPGINAPPEKWLAAVHVDARRFSFDPVRRYLEALKWDRVPRLDSWIANYLHPKCDDEKTEKYIRAVGSAWMISAVARTFKPGCKADCALVIEGRQGIFKSTAIKILAGEEWFSDDMPPLESKDAKQHVHGPWIIELAELDSLKRSEIATVKSFLTRMTDKFRPPYGHVEEAHPRRCIFAGTTNDDAYLLDSTGNRRFWPVKATRIDTNGLRAARDQLWAEAVVRFRAGAPWYLTADLEKTAVAEQAARLKDDSWDAKVTEYVRGRDYVTVADVLEMALDVPTAKQDQPAQNRVAASLKRIRWWRKQRREGERRFHVYLPPTPEDDA
jgi:putative DNA primase/helicase